MLALCALARPHEGVRRDARSTSAHFSLALNLKKDQDQFENGPLTGTGQIAVAQKFAQYVNTNLGGLEL